ncbi:MAG: hypothetical protein AAFX01_01000 [Cyanobacteria bacterium J06638_28]
MLYQHRTPTLREAAITPAPYYPITPSLQPRYNRRNPTVPDGDRRLTRARWL